MIALSKKMSVWVKVRRYIGELTKIREWKRWMPKVIECQFEWRWLDRDKDSIGEMAKKRKWKR